MGIRFTPIILSLLAVSILYFPVLVISEPSIDVLSYMLKNDISKGLSSSDFVWHQIISGNDFYLVKWRDPQQIIHYKFDSNYIYMTVDNTGQYPYKFTPGIWARRFMAVGETINMSSNRMQTLTAICQINQSNVNWPYYNTLEAHYPAYDLGGDLGIQDVIILKYAWGSPVFTDIEREYYAKGYGIVKWEYWKSGQLIQSVTTNKIASDPPVQMDPLCYDINDTLPARNAVVFSQYMPPLVSFGQPFSILVMMKNIGTTNWTAADGYRLVNSYIGQTLSLESWDYVPPGQVKTFTFTYNPLPNGTYNHQWQMYQDGFGYFGHKTIPASVTVLPPLSCVSPVNLQPSGNMTTTSNMTYVALYWYPVAGAVSYNVRLSDGTADRWDDARFVTCPTPSPNYYCENGITTSSVTGVPVRAGRTYLFWVDPIFSPQRNYCNGTTTFGVIRISSCSSICELQAKRCGGVDNQYAQTCGDYNSDGCYEWNTGTYCQFGCSGGLCNGDPCASVVCNSPPAAYCSGNIRYYYASAGSCSAGVCSYQRLNKTCEFGCADGQCLSQNNCSDGTVYGSCSITKPFYCHNGTLVEKCSVCGCVSGVCGSDGKCYVNMPPILDAIGSKDLSEGETLEFTVMASDPDGDSVTLFASGLPAGASFDRATGMLYWAPSFGQTGNYWVTFYAVDDGEPQLSDYEMIRITVGDVNRPPEIELVEDKKTDENILIEFAVRAYDPDGNNLTYFAEGLPAGARLDNKTGAFSWVPSFGQEGNYRVKIRVSDGSLTSSREFTITVGDVNRPPVAAISYPLEMQEFFAGNKILFSAAGSYDHDGDRLNYSWEFGDGDVMASETPAAEHVYKSAGRYVISLFVTDGKMHDTRTVEILIKEAPQKDSDGDGVDDATDKCPGTQPFTEINVYGCPMPKYKAFENNLTTDFSKIDLTNATNVIIGIPERGKIEFRRNTLNLVGKNLDKYIEIGKMNVTVKTGIAPELNISAVITFYNVTIEDPVITRDSAYCQDCRLISHENRTLVFSVPHFTTYSLFSRISFSGYCGDSLCSVYETCTTCSEDCGECRNETAGVPKACEELWVCSGWSKCNELNLMTRECVDVNVCETLGKKPREAMECREEQDLTSFVFFTALVMTLLLAYLLTETYKRRREMKKMDEFELEKFVKGYIYRGYTAYEIRKMLIEKGYAENEVSKILKKIEKEIF